MSAPSDLVKRLGDVLADNPHPKSLEFYEALVSCAEMFYKKNKDYGTSADPLRNVNASKDLGIEPWLGSYLRLRDKIGRLDTYCKTGKLANEGVEDSLTDIAVYALICLILFREAKS